jgi:hypothetical protein
MRVGIVGLGVGALATYSRSQDFYKFYEINPTVEKFARERFRYLSGSSGKNEVVLKDARIALEEESPQSFDVLVLDAFSGDAIPVHLLTLEAAAIYRKHLKPSGAMVFHISNRFVDLKPVVLGIAEHTGSGAVFLDAFPKLPGPDSPNRYAIVSTNSDLLRALESSGRSEPPQHSMQWQDGYTPIVPLMPELARFSANGREWGQTPIPHEVVRSSMLLSVGWALHLHEVAATPS